VTLLGFELAEFEAFDEAQPARATTPGHDDSGDQEELVTP
jgi:hypothetical protein